MRKALLVVTLLGACDRGEPAIVPVDPFAGIELATVPEPLAEVPAAKVVITSKSAIAIDGKTVVPITNGKPAPSELEGGEHGRKLLHLQPALTASHDEVLVLAVDRATPYRLLVDEMFTAKSKPVAIRRFAIVAAVKGTHARTALMLNLPEMRPAAAGALVPAGAGAAATAPLRLIVTETADELRVWSLDGGEGTLEEPALRVAHSDPDAANKVRSALAAIVKRRFDGHLPKDEREIVFMAADAEPAATFIPVMAAMHAVVPDIVLSSGFE